MGKKKFWIFLAVCFGISLLAAGLFHFLGGNYKSIWGTLFATGYMFIPLISVVITQLITGEKPFSGCGVTFKMKWLWLVIGLLAMQAYDLVVLPVSALLPGVEISTDGEMMKQSLDSFAAQGVNVGPWGILGISLISAIFAACSINALFAFGEEVAWRGFLSRLLKNLGFWKKSLLVGFIWGVWHSPVILMGHNYPEHPVIGVFMMIAFCMLFAPFIQFIRAKAKSVIAAAVMHGSLNASAGLAIIYLSGYNDLTCGCCGAAGFAVLLVIDIIIAIYLKKRKSVAE